MYQHYQNIIFLLCMYIYFDITTHSRYYYTVYSCLVAVDHWTCHLGFHSGTHSGTHHYHQSHNALVSAPIGLLMRLCWI